MNFLIRISLSISRSNLVHSARNSVPFLFAFGGEQRFEARRHRLALGNGVEDQHVAVGAFDELHRPRDRVDEVGPRRHGPRRLLQRHRADPAQLPPHRHPMAGRLGRQAVGEQDPVHGSQRSARYASRL